MSQHSNSALKSSKNSKLSSRVNTSFKSALRLVETSRILSLTAVNWLLGDRPPPPILLRQLCEKLGTTYIKLGQFIASSPSMFPDAYVEEFQHCLDNTPPIDFKTIQGRIQKSLKVPLSEHFQSIDPTPLATASIAQVHAAVLKSGIPVVIKVQKPGIKHRILTDLNFLYIAARILEWLAPHLSMASLSDIVEEIQQGMLKECDFLQEASNILEFSNFVLENNLPGVIAPKVFSDLSTDKVLVMEHLYGVPFTDLDTIREKTQTPEKSLVNAMNAWVMCLLKGHTFHADVHAGNLLVLDQGTVAFIDFGIVGKIRPEVWQSIAHFIQAIYVDDFDAMAKAMITIGITKEMVDEKELAHAIRQLYKTLECLQPDTSDQAQNQHINRLMLQLINVGKEQGIHFPREFALLLKQILYFDRYLQLFTPDADLFNDNELAMFKHFKF